MVSTIYQNLPLLSCPFACPWKLQFHFNETRKFPIKRSIFTVLFVIIAMSPLRHLGGLCTDHHRNLWRFSAADRWTPLHAHPCHPPKHPQLVPHRACLPQHRRPHHVQGSRRHLHRPHGQQRLHRRRGIHQEYCLLQLHAADLCYAGRNPNVCNNADNLQGKQKKLPLHYKELRLSAQL